MKFYTFFLIFVIAVAVNSKLIAQVYQLPNSGFENWDGNNYDDEPTQWNGFPSAACDLSFPASLGCGTATETRHEKSTDTRPGTDGNYSCKLFATSAVGIIANGTITTGQIRIGSTTGDSPENYNISRTDDSSLSQIFNAKPDSVVFWAKFVCPSTSQKARISTTIHDNYNYRDPESSDANASNHIVGKAIKNFTRDDQEWHRHSVAFDYNYPATTSKYILLTLTTNMIAGEGSTSDQLFVDDIEFIYITELSNIYIDGITLNNFSPSIHSYNIDTDCGITPIIAADCFSNNATVNIIQSDGNSPAQITVSNGNESTTYTINFNYNHTSEISDNICQGETYSNNGFNLGIQNTAGQFTYEKIVYESETCDSIVILNLTVNPTFISDTNHIMICETGEYNFHGTILIDPGIYENTLPSSTGCDSTIIVNLTVGQFYRSYINAAICEGETYNENGFSINEQIVDTLFYTAINGCDSIVILNLDINPKSLTEIYDTISQGGIYTNHGFEIFTTNSPGDFTFENSFENTYGCDSTIFLHLNITKAPEDSTQIGNTEFGFMLYPNPSTEEIVLKAENQIDYSLEYAIYDTYGKIIRHGAIINEETCIEINRFAAGVYFIKIISPQGESKTMKFIKY